MEQTIHWLDDQFNKIILEMDVLSMRFAQIIIFCKQYLFTYLQLAILLTIAIGISYALFLF